MNHFHDPGLLEPLTEREKEILRLLAAGLSNHEIAQRLVLAPGTVKVHTRNLYGKLGANSRAQAILRAGELGYLDEAVDARSLNHNLPAQSTPFVGRERELNELAHLFHEPSLRLMTILGPGGMGKSRLALEAAAMIGGAHGHAPRRVNLFPDGIYFVALASLSSPDFMVSTIAEALGNPFYGAADPRQQLLDHLRSKTLLLVMDNFEHVLDGATLLSDMLAAAPGVKIIATSRERLNLLEETIFRIEGIDFPESDSLANIQEYSASRLFMQSAGRVLPGFDPQPDDLKYVARICRLVQGMPLGILLATAWIDALSLKEIADEIEHSLDFLATEMRNLPEHLRSIRAVFERSWNLLKDEERVVFKRLSVFHGGLTREAAQLVAGASLRDLTVLVNKSLLKRDLETGRYEVHELLRQYAEEKLDAEEKEATLDRHCAYYMDFLAQSEAALRHGQQQEALAAMDNIRAAWSRAIVRRDVSAIRKAIFSLEWIYEIQGWYREAQSTLGLAASALRTDDLTGEKGIAFGKVLASWGFFSIRLGDVEKGHHTMREGLAILRRLDARLELADCLMQMTDMPGANEDYAEDKRHAQEAHDLFMELGVKWGIAHTLNTLGNVAIEHEQYEEAAHYYGQGLQLERETGNPRSIGWALLGLGEAAIGLGKYEEAIQHLREGLVHSQEIGYQIQVGTILARLGEADYALDNVQEAHHYWCDALQIGIETHMPTVTLLGLVGLSRLMLRENMQLEAVELLALAKHHPGAVRAVGRQATHLLDALESQFPPDVFHAAVERGKTLELDVKAADLLEQYA
jgi:predicted ATPase/DNA-binding CsgD family transcriptional regulator